MKTIYKALILTAAATVLASCDRTDSYLGGDVFNSGDKPFVTLDFLGAQGIREDAGIYKVPVRVLGKHGTFSVTVQTEDGTAINGKDFALIEPKSGVLNFGTQDAVKYVEFSITRGEEGIYTEPGVKSFTFLLASSTGSVELGSVRKATMNINDSDHPLTDIIGPWNASANDYFSGDVSWKMTFMPVEGDLEKLRIDGITSYFVDGYKPEEDIDYTLVVNVTGEEGARQFVLPMGKEMKSKINNNTLSVWGFDKQYVYSSGDLVFVQQKDGSIKLEDDTMGYGIGYATSGGSISLFDLLNPGTFSMTKAN